MVSVEYGDKSWLAPPLVTKANINEMRLIIVCALDRGQEEWSFTSMPQTLVQA